MRKPGVTRLDALPARDVWHARTALTMYAAAPRSTVTVALSASGLKPGDVAGLVVFDKPHGWIGVECRPNHLVVTTFDEGRAAARLTPTSARRIWLGLLCDFVARTLVFRYSTNGRTFVSAGTPRAMGQTASEKLAVACSLFCCTDGRIVGGVAEFDSFVVDTTP